MVTSVMKGVNNMPLYNEKYDISTLSWGFIFPSAEIFEFKMQVHGSTFENHEELYDLLAQRYVAARTRYVEEEPFILAIIRELKYAWPMFLEQQQLMETIKNLEIEKVMASQSSLTNIVQSHDDPIVDADKIAISDLSNQQQVTRVTGNELMALMTKYEAIQRNYIDQLYRRMDPLFRVFLAGRS